MNTTTVERHNSRTPQQSIRQAITMMLKSSNNDDSEKFQSFEKLSFLQLRTLGKRVEKQIIQRAKAETVLFQLLFVEGFKLFNVLSYVFYEGQWPVRL